MSYFEFLLHEGPLRRMSEYKLLIDFFFTTCLCSPNRCEYELLIDFFFTTCLCSPNRCEYELLIDFLLQRVFVLRIGVSTSYSLTSFYNVFLFSE